MKAIFAILACWLVQVDPSFGQHVDYPLQVGDRWEYIEGYTGSTIRNEVLKDTILSDGLEYACFSDGSCQRQLGDSVFKYGTVNSLYDFSKSLGDTIRTVISAADTLDLVVTSFDTVSMFGRNLREWGFHYHYRHLLGSDETFFVTDSLGLTGHSTMDGALGIKGAIIGGVTYGTITGVEKSPDRMPAVFILHQNFPNPFNPQTTISYDLPERTFVTLSIFNMLGEKVASLVNESQDPGFKLLNFDAFNQSRQIASGIYFIRLTASSPKYSFSSARKMDFLK